MVKVDLSSIHKVTAKGRTYYYAWRGKGAPRLLSAPGSPEFIAEITRALEERSRPDDSRIDGLCVAYKASTDYTGLSEATRRNWGPWIDRIRRHFGPLRVAQFDKPAIRRDIRAWRDGYKDKPRTADMALQVLSRVMSYAVAQGMLGANPCTGIEHLYSVDRSDLIWRAADLAALEKVASPEVMQAARLASLTGLRQGDLLRLSWTHIGPLAIQIRTGKSGQRKTTLIPIFAELRALLDSIPRRTTTVLTNTEGGSWGTGFRATWRRTCARAGITELHFHDLRGTAATRMFLAGLSVREIAEVMTWSEEGVEALINRYVKRDEILLERIRRMDEHASRTARVKPPVKPPRAKTAK